MLILLHPDPKRYLMKHPLYAILDFMPWKDILGLVLENERFFITIFDPSLQVLLGCIVLLALNKDVEIFTEAQRESCFAECPRNFDQVLLACHLEIMCMDGPFLK